jgi:hypothetical protein
LLPDHSQNEAIMDNADPWRPPSSPAGEVFDDDAQRVFDTVTGPNLRMSDNMIQAASISGGGLLCAIIGAIWAWRTHNPLIAGVLVGGFAGVVVSLFLSGAVLGVVRFISAVKKR